MLSGMLARTLVGNTLTGQVVITAGKKQLELNTIFDPVSSKSIVKRNLNLMVFIRKQLI